MKHKRFSRKAGLVKNTAQRSSPREELQTRISILGRQMRLEEKPIVLGLEVPLTVLEFGTDPILSPKPYERL